MLLEIFLAIIFAIFFIAIIINRLLIWLKPNKDWKELTLRLLTWWMLIILFSFVLLSPYWVGLIFFALVSFVALKEFLALISLRYSDRISLFCMFFAIPINYTLIGLHLYNAFIIFIPIFMFLFLPICMAFSGVTDGFLRNVTQFYWILMITVFALSHTAFLLILPNNNEPTGALLVLFLVGLTEANDIAQYLWGNAFGKMKVIPSISPNKTLFGLCGGIITTTLLATFLGPILTPLNWYISLFTGLMIGVIGFCGDIVISAIKRDVGVKDTGTFLPGHGGILDRVDSLTFTAPLFFYFMKYFYY